MNSNMIDSLNANDISNYSVKNKSTKKQGNKDDGFNETLSFAINISSVNSDGKKNISIKETKENSVSYDFSSNPKNFDSVSSDRSKGTLKEISKKSSYDASSLKSNSKNASSKDSLKNDRISLKDALEDSDLPDEVKDILNDIKNVFEDALNVTDEDIVNTMSELGLSMSDLLNPNKLANLILTLTGNADSDISAVLTDSSFNDIFSKLNEMGDEILSLPDEINLFFTNEEGEDLTPDMLLNDETDPSLKTINELLNGKKESDGLQKIAVDIAGINEAIHEDMAASKNQALPADAIENTENPDAVEKVPLVSENADGENNSAMTDDTLENGTSQKNSQNFGKDNIFENNIIKPEVVNTSTAVSDNSFAQVENVAANTLKYQSIDALDLINQISSHARTTITDTVRSMEMELNPESLGRMLMKVSEQEGTVSAHITVQNEDVKEALSNQMALLKTNLEATGMKVDEVTVTADPHEFERNLEEGQETPDFSNGPENGTGNGNEAYEESKNNGIGSINLSTMTSADAEKLSEDERLQANIMNDNGNTMNIKA